MSDSFADSSKTSTLLRRANDGDEVAFRLLIQRHLPLIRETVRRRLRPQLRVRVDNSDIVQETQKTAFERLSDFLERRPMPFRLWLLKTAHERILMAERAHLRAAKRSVDREIPMPDRSSMVLARKGFFNNPASEVSKQEFAQIVRRCVAKLPEKYREVLVLRTFNGLNNGEVAEVLELSADAARKRFARALLKLKDELKAAGIDEADNL